MPSLDARPRLRNGLVIVEQAGRHYFFDQFRIAWPPLPISQLDLLALQYFDGRRTLDEIRTHTAPQHSETSLIELHDRYDRAMYLDSPRFREYLNGPVRRSSVFRDVPAVDLTAQIEELFRDCGRPGPLNRNSKLKAVLVPHMDYLRGGGVYGHGFKALAEGTDATLFVIVATSHYSPRRFTLTRMDFETPLGRVPTDQAYVDRIVKHYGDGLFDDPLAHLPEHSIELEVAILQHLWKDRGPFRIVPLLVGSFHDCVEEKKAAADVVRMIEALKQAEREAGEKVIYIISGDLAHIGKKFDDPDLLTAETLHTSKAQDDRILQQLQSADAESYLQVISDEHDRRRICGLPPTFVTLKAIGAKAGEVLAYNQYVHPAKTESVSFASSAFF